MGGKYITNFYPEVCCDDCNEIIHNHFDCPICKREYVGTSIYYNMDLENYPLIFLCEKCGSKFRINNTDGFDYDDCEIELIK